jgi:hypothetical protein
VVERTGRRDACGQRPPSRSQSNSPKQPKRPQKPPSVTGPGNFVTPPAYGCRVRPLILRDELPPDDAIVVVRGGTMNSEFVRSSATDAFDDFGFFGVSVSLALECAVDELCSNDPRISRYGKVRLSTAGRIRALGFALLPTLARPHYDVVLPDLADETLDRLELAFDLPIPRPNSRKDQ